ncbi:hypothetical protein KKI90_21795 [Xenorhabdus bovienii]|uniref:hypothetical protein n=1 Tax=Xenorhabdus bovienii TaxID=40576 RepID=UPI00237C8AAE|nr:hypothetical protein [Xenorhabdus bovienii]MDE1488914.1 hypothetical protein [Xenorhabdus bovienii]MDE9479499.1 hypothetical protein [Xenorhabdus bovienii]MDE9532472.1 hypothetical protein [Xenorhabdus bovienii]MDE9536807.1 hypothetical protein [Xenorhabdus bovienii]MDE9589888.1 hypothetical protein [Xenorhabdus bovienii]
MSGLLDKLCSCGGNNSSCSICGGWGYIDSISTNRIVTSDCDTTGMNYQPAQEKKSPDLEPNTKKDTTRTKKKNNKNLVDPNSKKSKKNNKYKKEIPLICSFCKNEVRDLSIHRCYAYQDKAYKFYSKRSFK